MKEAEKRRSATSANSIYLKGGRPAAYDIALETARSLARKLYHEPVVAELGPLLRLLVDDVSITFVDKTRLRQTILRNGQEEDVDRLSGGMRGAAVRSNAASPLRGCLGVTVRQRPSSSTMY